MEKTCSKCGVIKPAKEFPRYRRQCKRCHHEDKRKYYEKNREKINVYRRNYQRRNPEKAREGTRNYKIKHAEKIREKRLKQVESLADSYVAKKIGISVSQCTPELLELKRAQIKLHRAIKERKNGEAK